METQKKKLSEEEVAQLQEAIIFAVRGIKPELLQEMRGFNPQLAAVDVTICGSKCVGAAMSIGDDVINPRG